jgi:cystathionine gamma-synthase
MADEARAPGNHGIHTRAVHGPDREPDGFMSTPIVHSSTFASPTVEAMILEERRGAAGAFYQRIGHPTLHATEQRLAALEDAEQALLFSSGIAAITATFLSLLRPGDRVVSLRQCYGGTVHLLEWGAEHLGWDARFIDARTPDAWPEALRGGARVLHLESPTNPTLDVVDVARAAALGHSAGAVVTFDNTFASPVGQHPLELGADLVVYSATKSIGGHADLLAGAVVGPASRVAEVARLRTMTGATPDPGVAWLIERSLKTLPLRVERQNANALGLARRLAEHPGVARVHYPGLERHPGHDVARRQMPLGFGPVLSFEPKGGAEAARAFVARSRLFRHAPSLGGVQSLTVLPAFSSHREMSPEERAKCGVTDGLIRLSVGIEDETDLWDDLARALEATAASPPRTVGAAGAPSDTILH